MDPVYLEGMYAQWKRDPASVDRSWQLFFMGYEMATPGGDCASVEQSRDQSRVASLIYNYRDQGHRIARTNPLSEPAESIPDLALERFGFTEADLDRTFDTGHLAGPQRRPLREILTILRETYTGSIGVEYLHIGEVDVRRWLQARMEPARNQPSFDRPRKMEILEQLVDAELLETFIHRHYLGQKRFSLEGAETLIPMVHAMIELAPELGVEQIELGMSHRGRLNVLANLLDKSYATIFAEFEDNFIEGSVAGDGDVKYHKGFSSDHKNRNGRSVHIHLAANPSHLEAVDPVVLGAARARQRQLDDTERRQKVLPLLLHGDAAFAGQGIVAETFNLSRLDGYQVGGTVHVVVNNQIGFTTLPGQARSSRNATDVARMVGAPIFHVNGDDPEAAVYAAELALRFRQELGRDVVLELMCYRKHGHSEGDEPGYTQPRLYKQIREHTPVRRLYTDALVASGELKPEEEQAIADSFQARLEQAHEQAREGTPETNEPPPTSRWKRLTTPYSVVAVDTSVSPEALEEVARGLTAVPEDFALNPKIARQLPRRLDAVQKRGAVDWALAEALAFGSLLREGTPVRLSGQDSERGTFSQRHSVWRDTLTEQAHVPLNHIVEGQAHFCVYNSPLSEASVLGFDFGYSQAEPDMLLLWEAQFGDFANGAQVIIDQFVVASHAKWGRSSGLVMMLPHGYEGQGPEHSNAYLERYLAAGAGDNIQVAYPSTPAQYFHLLRRQVRRPFRRPLVVMTPKSMLRRPSVVSPLEELTAGGFEDVLADPSPPQQARRLVLATGKVAHDLLDARQENSETAIVRVEQLHPFPREALERVAGQHGEVDEVLWVQEEPQNRGAWTYMEPRLRPLFPQHPIKYVGRPASASPATGSLAAHRRQQAQIVERALGAVADQGDTP